MLKFIYRKYFNILICIDILIIKIIFPKNKKSISEFVNEKIDIKKLARV